MALRLTNLPFRLLAIAVALAPLGCEKSSVSTSNSNAASEVKTNNSNADVSSKAANVPGVLEPERYFVNVTATLESKRAGDQALSFSFAKLLADRRWSFQLSQGQVVCLEKSGLKYLVFPSRGQYCEIAPGEAGFQPTELITPNRAWARLKTRPAENLGLEPVNARTAIKYRYVASSAAAERSEFLFVDQETGLALRSELSPTEEKDAGDTRLIIDARDLQLNPDSSQFDVPSGMNKVSADQLKPQISALLEALRPYSVFF